MISHIWFHRCLLQVVRCTQLFRCVGRFFQSLHVPTRLLVTSSHEHTADDGCGRFALLMIQQICGQRTVILPKSLQEMCQSTPRNGHLAVRHHYFPSPSESTLPCTDR